LFEAPERRDRRDQCIGLIRWQLVDDVREHLNYGVLPASDVVHAVRAQGHEDHASVIRVGPPFNQA
jgi:hypothetical protein